MVVNRPHPSPSEEFWESKGPGVKRLFERWDYGHITTRRFLEELEMMGIGVPEEVVVLLTHNEKARGVHFTELAKILIRANRPCETPPSPAPSQVSSVSDASHRSRAGRREILRPGEESASAKAPFDNDYVAHDMSPKSCCSFRSDASSVGSRYSQRSYGYDALQRGRGVAAALGAEDDDIAEVADLEATLRSYGTSADVGELAPALHSHLSSGSAKLADGMELPGEPRKHPETEHSRAASDHGLGILRGYTDDENSSRDLSPKRGVAEGLKSKKHFTGRAATFNPFSWEERTATENKRVVDNRRGFYPFATEHDDLNTLRCSINRAPLSRVGRTSAATGVHPDANLATLLN
ncbi:hypothetical protein FOZ63_000861 [Perkinsus olseni]|uniref:Uncharacterized protein n=1 Tax=Perkinsus olseni TaxID=32597 RepID=A0A7J6QWV8_PEROL|nr:hypothetical protein FOZ63_000861 [Perkinsus olseni]KAF4712186.1 hypothetical protein FOZ62_029731 [Perkinsus olseni]